MNRSPLLVALTISMSLVFGSVELNAGGRTPNTPSPGRAISPPTPKAPTPVPQPPPAPKPVQAPSSGGANTFAEPMRREAAGQAATAAHAQRGVMDEAKKLGDHKTAREAGAAAQAADKSVGPAVNSSQQFNHVARPPSWKQTPNNHGGTTTVTDKPTSDPKFAGQRFENTLVKDKQGQKVNKETIIYDYKGRTTAVK